MKLPPQKECMFCKHRSCIQRGNLIECLLPHPDVKLTPTAYFLGIGKYPENFAFQSKITHCPNWEL